LAGKLFSSYVQFRHSDFRREKSANEVACLVTKLRFTFACQQLIAQCTGYDNDAHGNASVKP
jgi:hypothetical protein